MADPIQIKSINTAQILVSLNQKLFTDTLAKQGVQINLPESSVLLRRFTFIDSRAATNLNSGIRQLPNVAKTLELTETAIGKFRAAKTEGAIKAFNMLVDEIDRPSANAGDYTKKLTSLKRGYIGFVSELFTAMETILPQSIKDNRTKPYLEQLEQVNEKYPPLVRDSQVLAKDGARIHDELSKITKNAEITLNAVAPEVVLADKNKAAVAQRRDDSAPSNFSPE